MRAHTLELLSLLALTFLTGSIGRGALGDGLPAVLKPWALLLALWLTTESLLMLKLSARRRPARAWCRMAVAAIAAVPHAILLFYVYIFQNGAITSTLPLLGLLLCSAVVVVESVFQLSAPENIRPRPLRPKARSTPAKSPSPLSQTHP